MIRFRNLDEVHVEFDGSDDEYLFVQSAGASTSPWTLSSLYPNQYSVFVADNDKLYIQTGKGLDLSNMVKQNNEKISHWETG